MKKIIFCLSCLLVSNTFAYGGILDSSVQFEDLAYLSEEGLNALKDTEFSVFFEQVKLAGAKNLILVTKQKY